MIRLATERRVLTAAVCLLVVLSGCQRQATSPAKGAREKQRPGASGSEQQAVATALQQVTLEVTAMT